MIYENSSDREQQNMAAFQFERHLRTLGVGPVQCVETPEYRRECYDFVLNVHGMWTGVVEVKARRVSSETVEGWGSLLVEVPQLTRLREQFYLNSPVTKKSQWTKEVIILNRCIEDDVCYAINIRDIMTNWNEFEDAPPEMIKDNHGTQSADRKGKLVPVSLMEKFS